MALVVARPEKSIAGGGESVEIRPGQSVEEGSMRVWRVGLESVEGRARRVSAVVELMDVWLRSVARI